MCFYLHQPTRPFLYCCKSTTVWESHFLTRSHFLLLKMSLGLLRNNFKHYIQLIRLSLRSLPWYLLSIRRQCSLSILILAMLRQNRCVFTTWHLGQAIQKLPAASTFLSFGAKYLLQICYRSAGPIEEAHKIAINDLKRFYDSGA